MISTSQNLMAPTATFNDQPWPPGTGSIKVFLNTPPPKINWFINERLLSNRAHLLTGIGGSSKTTFLYHLAIGATLGKLPCDWEVNRTGAAVLILAEDDENSVHRTIAAHKSALNDKEIAILGENLHIYPLAGETCHLLVQKDSKNIEQSSSFEKLLEKLESIDNLVFVGLDPALGLTEGDELSANHQRRLGELADKIALHTNACVVLVSHAAKGSAHLDEMVSHSSRGSGALTDAVRGEFTLRTMTSKEAKKYGISDISERMSYVQLAMTKGNSVPPSAFEPIWFKRGRFGLLEQANLTLQNGPNLKQMKALEILKEMSRNKCPEFSEWREECIKAKIINGDTADKGLKSMQRLAKSMLEDALIESGFNKGSYVPVEIAEETTE